MIIIILHITDISVKTNNTNMKSKISILTVDNFNSK